MFQLSSAGKLPIQHLPTDANYLVGVYNHSEAINDFDDWTAMAMKVAAVGRDAASSTVPLYSASSPETVFNATGTYMVALYDTTNLSFPMVLYKTGISFTNGGATVDVDLMTDLLGIGPGMAGKGKLIINNLNNLPPESSLTAVQVVDSSSAPQSIIFAAGVTFQNGCAELDYLADSTALTDLPLTIPPEDI